MQNAASPESLQAEGNKGSSLGPCRKALVRRLIENKETVEMPQQITLAPCEARGDCGII
jgi:hypothetical protein